MEEGKLIIFSAPSGSGKTSIVQGLMKKYDNLGFSISATTRPKRGNEVHGKDYYFLTEEEFRSKIEENEFAEFEEVYPGRFYGTLKSEIKRLWSEDKHVLFDVDVKGGVQLKKSYQNLALAVFVKVPSFSILEKRLRDRATEDEANIQMRLARVKEELTYEIYFDKVVLNDELSNAIENANEFVKEFIEN